MRAAMVAAGLWPEDDPRDPSQTIAAAWEVVEKLQGVDQWAFTLAGDVDDWEAVFWEGDTFHGDKADTAPHAICNAALAAVGALPTPGED